MRRLAIAMSMAAAPVIAGPSSWEPPALVPDNAVLEALRDWPMRRGYAFVAVFGRQQTNRELKDFAELIVLFDTADLIDEAQPADGVALAYAPPFVVYFVHEGEVQGLAEQLKAFGLENLDRPLIHLAIDYGDPQTSHGTINADWKSNHLFLMPVEAPAEQVQICAAQAVVTLIYAGEVMDDADYAACLEEPE